MIITKKWECDRCGYREDDNTAQWIKVILIKDERKIKLHFCSAECSVEYLSKRFNLYELKTFWAFQKLAKHLSAEHGFNIYE